MSKKLFLLISLIFLNTILDSCCNGDDQCFDLDSFKVSNLNLNGNVLINPSDTVEVNKYAFILDAETVDLTCMSNLDFGSCLYAFKCDEPFYYYQDNLLNISIISSSDLNENYKAGTELKDLFKPMELNEECIGEFDNSSSCLRDYSLFESVNTLEDAFNNIMAVNFYVEEKGRILIDLHNLFSLNIKEDVIANNHIFSVIMVFDSGVVLEMMTTDVYIK